MKAYKYKRKDLKDRKREAMETEFKSSNERKLVTKSFKRESRSLKRSERNEVKRNLKDLFGLD
jgi:hypothetical protein